ncbi:NAD-dependent aldehyde dehydrogenase [Rubrobacter radiotolerans]|uniref:NAD-dependent aldehyde dehydrogenase n=1 Tax=Rubrobacter radiotolerans TaxID=42256 RepID=A0A023X7K4_RUBRA|nr:NAD-dependent succinate-semialdehyde dehydrogenase [Rubrobacter radiotolerans]AHY48015.1 NAD-dependent aldehyde dehydrogenase [Rubrobacter radiotolerans]MDX5892654.1 NAD-dependent succinate-semialdehyde dehydrogenase [Rubrobacter radiotolerans]SMC08025.1 succinate-semialdehyde dehydrogenase / glutarate-semialdehyde dehydrogenase [Rubrobacter radiotolerans DSM 5868]
MAIASTNPATGETVKTFEPLTDEQIEEKIQRAADTFRQWRRTGFEERKEKMLRAAEILEDEAEELGRIATLEMGKTYASAVAEVQKCARGCRFYAENAERFLADERIEDLQQDGATAYVRYEPLGPTLEIMPWNFPYWQVFRHAAPGLMAGNVALLKHASNVPQVALAIEDVFLRAGFPEGAFQTLLIGSDKVKAIIEDERIRAATLTGSEPAGRMVAAQAGENIKPTVLELGGSDPFIVMPSADFEKAVETAVASRTLNNGQSCVNAKRIIVHEEIADEFTRRLVEKMEALKVGDPMDEATEIGPLSTPDGVEEVADQVRRSVEAGAKLLTGGERPEGPGNFYPPTVLAEIPEDAPARYEEIFGPVASVYRVSSVDEAIELANDSPFGLSSSVWTADEGERERFVEEIEAGMVYVNKMTESTPEVPFGGAKNSGYGRELSRFGIQEFTNAKMVWVQDA